MPRVEIYLDDASYDAYLKLKSLLKHINKVKGTKISISYLLRVYIRKLVEVLEFSDLEKARNIKLDLPSIEINIDNVKFEEAPKVRNPTITSLVLWSLYQDWKRQYRQAQKITKSIYKAKQLTKIKNDILKEVKKYKELPKELLEEISKLLAKIDIELENSMEKIDISFT